MRLGILASHPIQYHAPWFRGLTKELELHVFFAHQPSPQQQAVGFGGAFEWDIDLLSGYHHTFLKNVARTPGVNHFFGCDTPEIREVIRGGGRRTENGGNRRFDAFIVCGWNLKSYWQAIRACRRAGIPILVRGDSQLDPTQSLIKRAVKAATHRLMLRQFDGFLSPGQRNREYLLHYGVLETKIFFTPHFVDNQRFAGQAAALRPSRLALRKAWRIPEDAVCALFCGKFASKKRPLDLVKAAEILRDLHPELRLHLLFVGAGDLGVELRANCDVVFDAESPISNLPSTNSSKTSASFAGFMNQTQISKAYVAADLLVLPSDYQETWGLVVNEAMASGLPAIVSNAAGCAVDLIEENRTGNTFECGDIKQLAATLIALGGRLQFYLECESAFARKITMYSLEAAINSSIGAVENVARAT